MQTHDIQVDCTDGCYKILIYLIQESLQFYKQPCIKKIFYVFEIQSWQMMFRITSVTGKKTV